MLLALLAIAWGCEEPSTSLDLEDALRRTDRAFADADLSAFHDALDDARAHLACLSEVAPTRLVTDLHRAEGLASWFDDAHGEASQAFAAVRRLSPTSGFDPDLVPPGHPLLTIYEALDIDDIVTVELPPPSTGSLRLDGQRRLERPLELPVVFQRLDAAGTVTETAYLLPASPTPPYPTTAAAPAEPTTTRRSLRTPLALSAVGAAVLSGALYAGAAAVHGRYVDPTTPTDRLDGLRATNNGLVLGSAVSLTAGVGLGVGALVSR
jgi:hypothetical protein